MLESPNQRHLKGTRTRMNKFISVFTYDLRFRTGGHFEKSWVFSLWSMHRRNETTDLGDHTPHGSQTSTIQWVSNQGWTSLFWFLRTTSFFLMAAILNHQICKPSNLVCWRLVAVIDQFHQNHVLQSSRFKMVGKEVFTGKRNKTMDLRDHAC